MDMMEAIRVRHSVRQYKDKPLEGEVLSALQDEIAACNRESGLHIQLVTNEPKAFSSFLARYGTFKGVKNYFALVGKKGPALEETCGYYGERLVLRAQQLGLNTCWVAQTYGKVNSAYQVAPGEKLCAVIAVGYGTSQGMTRKSKTPAEVSSADGQTPDWFAKGVEAALLAPTAVNQQKFRFTLKGDTVTAEVTPGIGFYTKIDLGIVKYHFELGAGRPGMLWKKLKSRT